MTLAELKKWKAKMKREANLTNRQARLSKIQTRAKNNIELGRADFSLTSFDAIKAIKQVRVKKK